MTTTTFPPTGQTSAAALVSECRAAVQALYSVDPELLDPVELGALMAELEQLYDATRGVSSMWAAVFERTRGFEDCAASSLVGWMRQQLRVTAREARRRASAGIALTALPNTRSAVKTGQIGAAHVDAFAEGLRTIGPESMRQHEQLLLDVARTCDADQLRQAIRKIRDTLDPDAADAAWARALEQRDVTVIRVGEGFSIRGFVDPETGTALRAVVYAGAAPSGLDDARTAGQRRCDSLRQACNAILSSGLPTDRGIRPQLFVTVPVERLEAAIGRRPGTPASDDVTRLGASKAGALSDAAVLGGFGEISDALLAKLACDCALTTVIIDRPGAYPNVLDVGRTARLATLKQRQAIYVQQGGTCFTPGCDNTHLEIHHMLAWSLLGLTDLANLRGYCTRCHHLIHQGKLVAEQAPDGTWRHRRRSGEPLIDHRRRTVAATRFYTKSLQQGGVRYAREQLEIWRRGGTLT